MCKSRNQQSSPCTYAAAATSTTTNQFEVLTDDNDEILLDENLTSPPMALTLAKLKKMIISNKTIRLVLIPLTASVFNWMMERNFPLWAIVDLSECTGFQQYDYLFNYSK